MKRIASVLASIVFVIPAITTSCDGAEDIREPEEEVVDPGKEDTPDNPNNNDNPDNPNNNDEPSQSDTTYAVRRYESYYLNVDNTWCDGHNYINAKPDGFYYTYRVSTNVESWDVEPVTEDWFTACKAYGTKVELEVGRNDTGEDRIGVIVVRGVHENIVITDTLKFLQGNITIAQPIDGVSFDVKPSTYIVDEKTAACFTGFNPEKGVYYLSDDTPPSFLSSSKSIILSPHVSESCPDGICGYYSVGRDTDGRQFIQVRPASIEEVITKLDMKDHPVHIGQHNVKIKDASGRSIDYVRTKASGTDKLDISIPKTVFRNWDQSILVTAAVDLSLSMNMSLQIESGRLDYFAVALDPDIKLDFEIDASVSKSLVDESYPFFTVLCGGIPAGPIVITPLIEFSLVIGAEGKIGVKAGIKYENNTGIQLIYQRNEGTDYSFRQKPAEDQKNKTELSGSVYMEGNISCGLDESVGLGVYGTILYATAGIQERVKCAANISVDIEKALQDPDWLGPTTMMFTTDVTLQGVFALKSLGATLGDFKTLEKPYRLDSLFMFPRFETVLGDVNGRQAHMELQAANDLLLPMGVGYTVYVISPDDPYYMKPGAFFEEGKGSPINMGSYTIAEHHRIDPINCLEQYGTKFNVYSIDLPLSISSGQYFMVPFFSYNGFKYEFKTYTHTKSFIAAANCEDEFRKILLDISRSMPDGMPTSWSADVPISNWKGVSISYDTPSKPRMTVNCKEIGVQGLVTVGNHTEGRDCAWILDYIDYVTGLDISDPNFDGWGPYGSKDNLEYLKFNVNSSTTGLKSLLSTSTDYYSIARRRYPHLKTLIFHGSNPWVEAVITEDRWLAGRNDLLPELETLSVEGRTNISELWISSSPNLDNVNIEEKSKITCLRFKGDAKQFKAIDVDQYQNISKLYIESTAADENYTIRDMKKIESLYVSGEQVNSLTLERSFKDSYSLDTEDLNARTIYLTDCNVSFVKLKSQMESFVIQDCKTLVKFTSYSGYSVKNLVLSKLPMLDEVIASNIGLTSVTLEELPVITRLRLENNHGIPRQVVPAIFDEIRLRNYLNTGSTYGVSYDETFIYYSKYDYSEADWGFYYPDEPDCGYHFKLSRIGIDNDW